MVAVVTLLDILLSYLSIKVIYRAMLIDMLSGWMPIYMAPWIFPLMFVLSFTCYLVISLLQMKRIKKIPNGRGAQECGVMCQAVFRYYEKKRKFCAVNPPNPWKGYMD